MPSPAADPSRPSAPTRLDRLLVRASWAYPALCLLALAALYLGGDRWWPATFLLFGPRWALALPLAALLPPALRWPRRLLPPLLLAAIVVFGPILGLRWSFGSPAAAGGSVVRVLTCNVRGGQCDIQALAGLARDRNVDLVALQECPPWVLQSFPAEWHKAREGAVVVLSRHPMRPLPPVQVPHESRAWPSVSLFPCLVDLPRGRVVFHSVYLPSAHYGIQHLLDRRRGLDPRKAGRLTAETENRRSASLAVRNAVQEQALPLILAGDFNLPPESAIYREAWADLADAFAQTGRGYGWTYRDSPLHVPLALRLDHVLSGNGALPLSCEVGPDVGSDHRPLIAEVLVP